MSNKDDTVISYADLEQFQFTYSIEEDRMLIELQATQNQRYQAWISRIFVSKIWTILLQVLQQKPLTPLSLDNPKEQRQVDDRHVEKRFEHQDEIVPQIEFWGEKKSGLIHTLHIEAKNEPILAVKLLDKDKQGVIIHLSHALFQVFCGLIVQTVGNSSWDLELENADWVINLNKSVPPEEIINHTIN